MTFFEELKRRKVFRVTSLYAVTAWGASLGAAELFPTFGLPESSVRWFVIGALGLLPIVALLAWLYELTPSGIERDPADTMIHRGDADQLPGLVKRLTQVGPFRRRDFGSDDKPAVGQLFGQERHK